MKIKALEGQNIEELSMIEVAHALLDQTSSELSFTDIVKEVQSYLKKSDDQMKSVLSRFYTDLNTDGSFIPLGNNTWGLRSWYAIDSIDEETISFDYFDEGKLKEEEIFDDIPVIQTDVDEEDNFKPKSVEVIEYDVNEDDEVNEAKAYDEELAEVEIDAEIPELEVGIIDDDDDDDSEEDEK